MSGDHQAPQQKFSRYRSVKHVKEEPSPPKEKENDLQRSKSMSRYRRPKITTQPEQFQPAHCPPVPSIPREHTHSPKELSPNPNSKQNTNRKSRYASPTDAQRLSFSPPVQDARSQSRSPANGIRYTQRPQESEDERLRRKVKEFQDRELSQRRALSAQEDQARKVKDSQERVLNQQRAIFAQEEEARMKQREAESAWKAKENMIRKLAEQKKIDLARLQLELNAAPARPATSPDTEKRGFFSRRRVSPKAPSASSGSTGSASLQPTRSSERRNGQNGISPQTDAPISASNAGERRILIRYKQSSINLPITPETTPLEIIYSAANIMNQDIRTSSAILFESYTHLGLERRIRRYEHIRDIMNSWDRDTQNALMLRNSDAPRFDTDLEASSVSRDTPTDVTVYMYHSQTPGKWNKRYITLLSTGQMFISKKNGAKLSDKDVTSICHLSDFDIYTPTPQQIRKTLKPPKKHCYAIKSQQKTTMFLSTENFVHFFSSDDEDLSEKFYDAVQKWRSWYLVNRMGEGKKRTDQISSSTSAQQPKSSADDNPYTIGTFKPLMDTDRFNSPGHDEESQPTRIPFHLRNSVNFEPLSRSDSNRHPPPVLYKLPPEAEDEFTASGLLGRSYTQRRRIQIDQEQNQNGQKPSPFFEGGLLDASTSGIGRTFSVKSGTSKRPGTGKPKPLLDFTPTFKEAPQWDQSGKGRGIDAPRGVPLIEVANTPDMGFNNDLGLPSPTLFRRQDGGLRPNPSIGPAGRPKTSAGSAKGGLVKVRSGERDQPFIKGGLVSAGERGLI